MKVLLLYNPISGRGHKRRAEVMQAIKSIFAAHGHETAAVPTTGPGAAAAQVRDAIAEGFGWIVACGGDGTVHDVLQGMIAPGRPAAAVALGVIPMGSANALARHLGLSREPLRAARQLLAFAPRVVPVGEIETATGSRFFTVLAGAGPDGALVHGMSRRARGRVGRAAYYARAAWLFLTRGFAGFRLSWVDAETGATESVRAVAAMTVRIDSLGGLFHRLAPAGAVHHPHLTLVAVRPPGWIGLPAWFAGSWLGVGHRMPLVVHATASEFSISPLDGPEQIHLQADGEWIGVAPARVRLIPEALRLLTPAQAEREQARVED